MVLAPFPDEMIGVVPGWLWAGEATLPSTRILTLAWRVGGAGIVDETRLLWGCGPDPHTPAGKAWATSHLDRSNHQDPRRQRLWIRHLMDSNYKESQRGPVDWDPETLAGSAQGMSDPLSGEQLYFLPALPRCSPDSTQALYTSSKHQRRAPWLPFSCCQVMPLLLHYFAESQSVLLTLRHVHDHQVMVAGHL